MVKDALFWKKINANTVQCMLCARYCKIIEGKKGNCGVRQNINGELKSLVYGKLISKAVDPIEKKPLYHFCPGTKVLSIATVGCNFHCSFCQNWEISQEAHIMGENTTPEEIVELAVKNNCQGIAYTYTEPTIFYEFAYDVAKLAKKQGLYNVFVTNGYISKEPLDKISPYLDAANVDLKSMSDNFYQTVCGVPSVKPVLDTIKRMIDLGIHTEITNLLIPGLNDSPEEINKLITWVKNISNNIPLHFSAYYPTYKLNAPPTPTQTLINAFGVAKKAGLNHVYLGNIRNEEYSNTHCPTCKKVVILRKGYDVKNYLSNNKCPNCKTKVI
ncbi:MAG: AmmeMemoRadiSam system radical SAM enzyme [Candidatus Aenigmarchaeota archaeon]|nr:AmmeMemoRadiSam system radical SAM enzyme [Candidatus Aenigmarchaeota archaeon]